MADKIMDVGPSRTIATVGAQSAVHPNMPVNQQQLSELVGALNELRVGLR